MRPGRAQKVETNLAVQQEVFERAYSTLLNGLKHLDKRFVDNLAEAHSSSESQRLKEVENLQKSLMAIAMVIQKLKHNIKNDQFVKDHDTEYFKGHLTSIEQNLGDFKCLVSEQLQALQAEEEDLQHSIDSLHQHINETSTTKNQEGNSFRSVITARAKAKVNAKLNEKVHPDIQEFNQFLEKNGGHTGGWDTKDHLLFTRFLHKYKGLDQMTTALLDFMPDKTPEEIAHHESWYHDYLTLKDAQRRALRDWRDEQTSHKQKKETRGCETSINYQSAFLCNVITTRDPSVKEKIKIWKERQEKLRQQQLEELQGKKKQEEESWKKKVAYFEQQRRIIAERRKMQQQSLVTKGSLQPEPETLIQKKHIPLKDFWEQDKLYILKRQSRLQRFSASPRTRSSSQSTVQAERNPTRLLRSTAVWRAHIRRSLSADGNRQPSASLYIADVPHLAVPKWREGLV